MCDHRFLTAWEAFKVKLKKVWICDVATQSFLKHWRKSPTSIKHQLWWLTTPIPRILLNNGHYSLWCWYCLSVLSINTMSRPPAPVMLTQQPDDITCKHTDDWTGNVSESGNNKMTSCFTGSIKTSRDWGYISLYQLISAYISLYQFISVYIIHIRLYQFISAHNCLYQCQRFVLTQLPWRSGELSPVWAPAGWKPAVGKPWSVWGTKSSWALDETLTDDKQVGVFCGK